MASRVRCCRREISQTCLTLPTCSSERWLIRNAYRSGAERRPVTGSQNQSGRTRSVRVTPSTSHSPLMSRSAAASTAALASAGTWPAASGGSTAVKRRSPAGGDTCAGRSSGRTCRRDQASRTAWSRARQATSAGDIRAARRAYQPIREAGAHTRSGRPLARLAAAARVALVVATSDSSEIGIGPPVRTASAKSSSSCRWPLSWPPRARVVTRLRPVHRLARWKLSSRALRPSAAASSVSLG